MPSRARTSLYLTISPPRSTPPARLGGDRSSPTWNVGAGCCGRDVGFGLDARQLSLDDGHAVVTGPPEFATCLFETAYTKSAIERGSLHPGETLCV